MPTKESVISKYQELKNIYNYSGLKGALTYIGYRIANTFVYFDCLRTMTLIEKDIDPKNFTVPEGMVCRPLSKEEVLRYSKVEKYQLTEDFLEQSLDNDDVCLAILEGEELASYGWYSKHPTKVTGEFNLHFSDRWVYMHHGYTNPDFRGKRLHAIGMANATRIFTEQGFDGLCSIVASENAFSLKSTRRLGYVETGKIFIFATLGRYLVAHSPGAHRTAMWLSPKTEELKSWIINEAA